MKCRIIQANGHLKMCPKCGNDVWRKSTRTINVTYNSGETYDMEVCDADCGYRHKYNIIKFERIRQGYNSPKYKKVEG